MSYSVCSENFSSRSLRGCVRYPGSSCSSYSSNLIHSFSPRTFRLGSAFHSSFQGTSFQPNRCQTSFVVSNPCQRSCNRPRVSTFCSPCHPTYTGSQGFGSRISCSLGYGSRSCYSSGVRPLGYAIRGFPCFGYRPGFCRPTYLASGSYQASCYRPTCGSSFTKSTC
ncbi:keratin-associated protein 13-1-like [Castor canadensis]|uniref:Keratin-associated protein n=1 Tax=Castor canadensis TaxID=51338 RepID=A0A8B7TMW9_CASCN|nr:keratin-associated protein 13-1-like [Castor canadensis]